jgi:hypothetical protein
MSMLGRQVASLLGELVTEEVLGGSGMWRGSSDQVCANSDCPSALEGSVEGPYVVVGLYGHPGTTECVIRTRGGSPYHYGGLGVCTEAARGVRRVLLRENTRVASRSHDRFGFRKGGVVYVGGGCRGRTGGVGACRGCMGGCTKHGWGCSWSGGACVSL